MDKKKNLPSSSELEMDFLEKYSAVAERNNLFDQGFYEKFNVKRGLRNTDGSGVVVGLTEIGEVHGYIMDEGEKTPSKGRLRYRGFDIKDLVAGFQSPKRLGFEETVYLLLISELPSSKELVDFTALLGSLRNLPKGFKEDVILRFPSGNIMNQLARAVLFTYSFDENPEDYSIKNILRQSVELIARFPSYIAYSYQAKRHYYDHDSLFLHTPPANLSTAESFLYMIRPNNQYTALEAEVLDLALVLHAEHGGGNNSSFSIRLVSSAGTDTYSAMGAAIGSLKGIKHGGANIKVMDMILDIRSHCPNWDQGDNLAQYLAKILKKETFDGQGLIYGMGHAVYTLSDPRAELLKDKARELAQEKGLLRDFGLYESIERLTPDVLLSLKPSAKEVCANVDLYSGFVYEMLGIPSELYTPIFAMARVAGWSAHRIEELVSGGKIIRPAYKNVSEKMVYTPLDQRKNQ